MDTATLVSVKDLILNFLHTNPQQAWAAFEIKERVAGLNGVSVTELWQACVTLAENDCITQANGSEGIRRYKIKA